MSNPSRGLTAEQREDWEERAAIREYLGGMPRDIAERLASEDIEQMTRSAAQERAGKKGGGR